MGACLEALLASTGLAERYDFLYVPIDFTPHATCKSFAFVNFLTQADAKDFMRKVRGFSQWPASTERPCNVSWAKSNMQGWVANVERYRNCPLVHELVHDSYRPATYSN